MPGTLLIQAILGALRTDVETTGWYYWFFLKHQVYELPSGARIVINGLSLPLLDAYAKLEAKLFYTKQKLGGLNALS